MDSDQLALTSSSNSWARVRLPEQHLALVQMNPDCVLGHTIELVVIQARKQETFLQISLEHRSWPPVLSF